VTIALADISVIAIGALVLFICCAAIGG